MIQFDEIKTYQPEGNGHSMVTELVVHPPLSCEAELGELMLDTTLDKEADDQLRQGTRVVMRSITEVGDFQHLAVEVWTPQSEQTPNVLKGYIDTLREYHGALGTGSLRRLKELLGSDQ